MVKDRIVLALMVCVMVVLMTWVAVLIVGITASNVSCNERVDYLIFKNDELKASVHTHSSG